MDDNRLIKLVIKSYSGFFERPQYEDKLILTNNSVNYEKEYSDSFGFGENSGPQQFENTQRSYKTKNGFKWFKNLELNLDLLEQEEQHVLDAGGYSFEIFYENGTKKSIHYFCDDNVKGENLQYIFYLLRKVVPPNEETPYYIQDFCNVDYDLLEEILKTLEKGEAYNGNTLKNDFLFKLIEFDFDYSKTMEMITYEKKQIETLSFDEIRAFITYMAKEENCQTGLFYKHLKNETILRVVKRLKKLISDDDEED